MKPETKLEAVALTVRVTMGAWFLYSGGEKIFRTGLDRFTRDVMNYQLVKPPLDALVAYSIPWLEIIAGLCLMLGILRKGTLLAMTGLVGTFVVAIGWALSKGLDISCGCHGGATKVTWMKVAENGGYLIALAFLWWMEFRKPRVPKAIGV